MTHYVCQGECQGVSPAAKVCEDGACSKKGEALAACECMDGAHAEVRAQSGSEAPAAEPRNEPAA